MNRVFVDTNVILDLLIEERANHLKSKALFSYLLFNDYEIVMSEDMLSTVYYIAKNKRVTLHFFQTIQDEWMIVPFGKDVMRQAFSFSLENKSDLEDTLQCFCAQAYACKYIITSDKKFVDCGVEIMGYEKFLEEQGNNNTAQTLGTT